MTSGLYWREMPKLPDGKELSPALKHVLAKEWFGHDGSLLGDTVVGKDHVWFLRGVAAAGTQEVREAAQELIAAVEKHGLVRVWIGDADDFSDG